MSRTQSTTRYTANLDTVIHAMEQRPDSKARASAWEWLSEATAFAFDGDALIVPSATWSATTYRATPTTCTCPAHAKGRWCWHKESSCIVTAAQREDEWVDLAESYDSLAVAYRERERVDLFRATQKRERFAESLAAVNELYPS
jgi:hypothetical protein